LKKTIFKLNDLCRKLCLFLIVCCLFMVFTVLLLGPKDSVIHESDTEQQISAQIGDDLETYLIVGIADDENERESTRLTDTIMVVSVDRQHNSIRILQIPRDTYVGNLTPTGKINAIYNRPESAAYHGLEGLSRRIEELFCLKIDHTVTLDMANFADIIDAMGGISMNVEQQMSYRGVTIYPGEQILDGEHALLFVRTRNIYQNGDLGRVSAQRQFLSAFADKVRSMKKLEMIRILPSVMRSIETDLSIWEMMRLYRDVSDIGADGILSMMPPGDSVTVNGQSVYQLRREETAALLNTYFRPDGKPKEAFELILP